MYCWNCGEKVNENAVVCVSCGVSLKESNVVENDKGGFGWGLLGFIIPIVGLILYLVWKSEKPKTAKAVGLGAIISVGVWILFYVLIFIIAISIPAYFY